MVNIGFFPGFAGLDPENQASGMARLAFTLFLTMLVSKRRTAGCSSIAAVNSLS